MREVTTMFGKEESIPHQAIVRLEPFNSTQPLDSSKRRYKYQKNTVKTFSMGSRDQTNLLSSAKSFDGSTEKTKRSVPRFGMLSSRIIRDVGSTQRAFDENLASEDDSRKVSPVENASKNEDVSTKGKDENNKFIIDYGKHIFSDLSSPTKKEDSAEQPARPITAGRIRQERRKHYQELFKSIANEINIVSKDTRKILTAGESFMKKNNIDVHMHP